MLYNNQGILSFYSYIICEQILFYLDGNFLKKAPLVLKRAKQKRRLRAKGGGGGCLNN